MSQEPQPTLRRLAGDALVYNLAVVLSSALSVVLVPILTRLFRPELYGLADTALQLATTLATLLTLGMDSAIGRQFFEASDSERRERTLTTGAVFLTCAGLGGATLVLGLADGLAAATLGSGAHGGLLRLVALLIPSLMVESYFRNILRWRGERWRYFILAVVGGTLRLLLSLLLAYEGGIEGLLTGAMVGGVIAAGLGFTLGRGALARKAEYGALPGLLAFGMPMAALGLAWPLTFLVDRALLVYFRSEWDLGIYAAGLKLAGCWTLSMEGLRQAWGPVAFSRWAQPSFPRFFGQLVYGYIVAGVALAGCLSLLAPELASLLLGPDYRDAQFLVAPLTAAFLAADLFNLLGIGLYYRRWAVRFALAGWIGVGLAGSGALVLVPHWAGFGAACANAVARFLAAIGVFAFSQRGLRVEYPRTSIVATLGLLPLAGLAGTALDLPSRMGLACLLLGLLGHRAFRLLQHPRAAPAAGTRA